MMRQYNLLKTIRLPYCLLQLFLSFYDTAHSQQILHQHNFVSNRIYFTEDGRVPNSPVHKELKRSVDSSQFLLQVASRSTVLGGLAVTINASGPTCGEEDGSFEILISGGTPPYQNSVNGMPFRAATTYVQLRPGVYNITVEDANGVTATTSIPLTNTYPGVTLNSFVYNGSSGCTQSDGSITVAVRGGTSPFLYSIDGGALQSGNVFSSLSAGDYEFVVVDSNGCTAGLESSIGASNCGLSYGYDYTPIICNPNTGDINLILGNGTPPIQYSLDGVQYQTSSDFQGLNPGIYTEHIKDGTGRSMIFSFSITQQCNVVVSAITTNASCGSSDGSIAATGDEGTPPYSFSLDKVNFQASGNFNGLSPGSYMVYMKDQTDYIGSVKAVVFSDCPALTTITTPAICTQPNGSITGTGSGGTPPYQYSLDGVHFMINNKFTGLPAGDYSLILKDANGFVATSLCTIKDNCVTVTAAEVDGSCGNSNGAIQATGLGGTVPYQYSLDGLNFQTSSNFNGLTAGPYIVTIKDAGGLTNSTQVSVGNQAAAVIHANVTSASCINNDGLINIIANGGTVPLQYSLDGVTFTADPESDKLPSGTYTVAVKDANGCLSHATVIIPIDTNLTVHAGAPVSVCQGNSVVLPATSNGSMFSWTPITGLSDPSLLDPSAGPPTTTKYFLRSILGICQKVDSVLINILPAPVANAGTDTSICFGKSIQLAGTGGLRYTWSPITWLDNTAIPDPTAVAPESSIVYSLVVTDQDGCHSINESKVTISVTPPPLLSVGDDTSILLGQALTLYATDVNHSGFTQYTWSPTIGLNDPFIQNPAAQPQRSMIYTVSASTPDGCQTMASLSIKVFTASDLFVPNAFTPNGDGRNDKLRVLPIGMRQFVYFAVYNRAGQLVFYTKDPLIGWDGTINSRRQETGTYIWMAAGINYKGDKIERKGTVILIK